MNSRNIHEKKKNISGRELHMEVMDDSEFTTVNPKCYDNLTEGRKYSVKEMVLILLGVDAKYLLKSYC